MKPAILAGLAQELSVRWISVMSAFTAWPLAVTAASTEATPPSSPRSWELEGARETSDTMGVPDAAGNSYRGLLTKTRYDPGCEESLRRRGKGESEGGERAWVGGSDGRSQGVQMGVWPPSPKCWLKTSTWTQICVCAERQDQRGTRRATQTGDDARCSSPTGKPALRGPSRKSCVRCKCPKAGC